MHLFMAKKELEVKQINKRIQALGQSHIFILIPQGLGDILYFCSYIKEYRRLHTGKKVALIITKKHFLDLIMLYKEFFETVLYIDISLFNKVDDSKFIYYESWIYNPDNPQEHLITAVKQGMGINVNTMPYYPTIYISRYEKLRIKKLIPKPGKTILISPEAVSCSVDIAESEWVYLADILERKGFQVYFNSGNRKMYGKYPKLFLPLRDTLIFTHYAGYFIGTRSGLCDVIAAFSNCKQIIIYPRNKKRGEFPSIKNYDRNPNTQYMEYCSLKKAFPDRIITEVICKKGVFDLIEREFGSGKDIS
jgi:hypothetical protein